MKPHEQRVIDEKIALDDKIYKLEAFIQTPVYASLDTDDRWLLIRQRYTMLSYSEILGGRIGRFAS